MDSIASKNSCGQSTKTLGAAKITVAFGARPRKFFETFHSLAVSLLFKSKCERKHEETKLSSPIFLYFLLPTENFPFPRAGAQATSSTHYSSTLAVPSDVPKHFFREDDEWNWIRRNSGSTLHALMMRDGYGLEGRTEINSRIAPKNICSTTSSLFSSELPRRHATSETRTHMRVSHSRPGVCN